MIPGLTVICGDAVERLRELAGESVHCCVTSPPFWGLRDYGTASWEGGDDACDHRQNDETLERQFSAASTLIGTTARQREAAKARYACKCGMDNPISCTVLDPFAGSGTTGQVALELGRSAILIELNPKYIPMIEKRCTVTLGLAF